MNRHVVELRKQDVCFVYSLARSFGAGTDKSLVVVVANERVRYQVQSKKRTVYLGGSIRRACFYYNRAP